MRPVAHPQFRDTQPGTTRRAELGLRMAHRDFLFQRHARQGIFYTLVYRLAFIEINGSLGKQTYRETTGKKQGYKIYRLHRSSGIGFRFLTKNEVMFLKFDFMRRELSGA